MNENYTFFWSGIFSQWYPSQFTINGITFSCAEQWMMYSKAKLFGDEETAQQILETINPKKQKELGRQVKNFDPIIWNNIARILVYQGNYAKFSQNAVLFEQLMNTDDTTLVEASPYDQVWGIGLGEEQAKITPPNLWRGKNWLGEVLTKLKNDLRSISNT
ncbi:MAG: NADAR family protein [Hydrotalea sp. AMD]|uniref:NADAR family protein n=1 Tax=Hydrotalea sp. AMD TaxID=2501297 RepID=UPI001028505C|nr:NADAR family protein [Hydrotalea sp. AMD]RWZ87234.1 MAG: NADAR family protein [Hydrotalea sp. AMD]